MPIGLTSQAILCTWGFSTPMHIKEKDKRLACKFAELYHHVTSRDLDYNLDYIIRVGKTLLL